MIASDVFRDQPNGNVDDRIGGIAYPGDMDTGSIYVQDETGSGVGRKAMTADKPRAKDSCKHRC